MAEVIMPKMGDAMMEGTLVSWLKQEGEAVKAGDVIAEIETDKSNVEVEAEYDGVLHIQAQPGAVVPVGDVIATVGDGTTLPSPVSSPPAPNTGGVRPEPLFSPVPPVLGVRGPGNGHERVKASPLARTVANRQGVDIAQVTGTGPSGRIIEADVLAFAQANNSLPTTMLTPPVLEAGRASAPTIAPTNLSPIRKVIARRMVESKTTIPHFYVTSEIDMAEAMALREKLNSYDETLPNISLNDILVKASALALVKIPAVNAAFRDDKLYPGEGVHVGIAVALEDGLIVPVVRDADRLPLRKLAQTSRDLIDKARAKKLQPAEYSGGTFTVSNLGGFDVESFTAIIDPSQGAILAVASITKKAVVLDDDTIAVRPRMNVTFSGDHRAMDGATGARWLQEFKRLLQNPFSLLEN